ncbi:MAG TPA: DUF2306 domain-containing protein [Candidatus Sulfotelmatobacter sp.]|jgi:uncharacterized membrane protein|nr:DUF2306 domain-containing protein [Candidatus Sulfotelmatobacter sp.]
MAVSKRAVRFLWISVSFLVFIGLAAVTRRTLVLIWPTVLGGKSGNPATALDAGFARHMALTLVHILPGALFLILGLFQFMPSIRNRHIHFHRWSGNVLMICGLIIGFSALVMSFTMNIGGPNETAATTLYAIVFLFCLIKAYRFVRRKEIARHREWMIRAYGVGLGVATTRPIVGTFFAFRRLTPHEFFGIAFWLGFTTTFLAAEAWVDYTRHHGKTSSGV